MILSFYGPSLLPLRGHFYALSVEKTFFDPLPLNLVHEVIERSLRQNSMKIICVLVAFIFYAS